MTDMQKRLLLFDIDGTLIHSGGAGVRALKSAFKERFGVADDLHGIEIAGMTDSGIVVSILKKNDIPATNENVGAFLDSYVHFLRSNCLDAKANCFPECSICSRNSSRGRSSFSGFSPEMSRAAHD
jgi:Predicted phosphatases